LEIELVVQVLGNTELVREGIQVGREPSKLARLVWMAEKMGDLGGFRFCGRHWEAVQKGVGDGADFYCKAGREKQSEGNILKIPPRFDHGSCMAPAQGNFVTFFKPSVSYSHLNGLIWAVR